MLHKKIIFYTFSNSVKENQVVGFFFLSNDFSRVKVDAVLQNNIRRLVYLIEVVSNAVNALEVRVNTQN